jgi:type I restriction enzyme S subunit
LLEGLEIRILSLKSVSENNRTFRIDSGYFGKYSYRIDSFIKSKTHFFLGEKEVVSGPFGSTLKSHSYLTEGIPFVRIENIRGGFDIDKSQIVYISEDNNQLLQNSQLFTDDLVLSKVGNSIGYYARVDEEIGQCNISENNLGIKLQNYERSLRHYILTFFNCKYGSVLTLRRISGNAQPKLNVFDISEIPIPVFSSAFYKLISNLIVVSKNKIDSSKNKYYDAENILLNSVQILNFQFSKDPINVKNLSESFGKSKRLDAEYYLKKYEEVVSKIVNQKHDILINIVEISKSIEPGSTHYSEDKGLPFYRVSDYNKFGLSKPDKELTTSFVEDNKDLIAKLKPKKGTILFSKDGSVGTAYLLRQDLNGITSGAILHLKVKNSKEILPEYLTLALNSKLVQMQAERDAGGSIILHWRKEEIEQVVVPIIDFKKQEQIAELVEESFKLKTESERLLEVAKKAVEIAIETDEQTATKFINDNKI